MRAHSTRFSERARRLPKFGAYAPDYGINDFSGLHPFGSHFGRAMGNMIFGKLIACWRKLRPREIRRSFSRAYIWIAPTGGRSAILSYAVRDDRGCANRESFASARWREDAACALRALIDHIASSAWRDCVVGYHIACGSTEEWTYHHYADEQFRLHSPAPNLHAFQTWLQRNTAPLRR